jgi:hypothetical protein
MEKMRKKVYEHKNPSENGVALFFSLFALLLLSAIAASLVLMSNTETSIDSNFKRERVADYAAKAGFEETRDRMMAANVATIAASLPVTPPPGNGTILYLLNEGNNPGSVQPWTSGNAYVDDELCHDGYSIPGLQAQTTVASDVRCTTLPSGASWYTTTTSNAPWSGTAAAMPYKWVRVAMKLNGTVQNYMVNSGQPATTQVCWNGTTEVLLNLAATCQAMSPSTNPVYVLTSLAITGSGTRKIVQTEVALDPAQPFPYGLYATGTTCPALTFSGGGNSNPATDSFSTANGGTYSSTVSDTGGDVGANGGVSLSGHAQIGGMIGVQSLTNPSTCNYSMGDISLTGSAGNYNPGNQYPNNIPTIIPVYNFPTPPDPSPLPPSTAYNGSLTMVPGTYGAVSASGQNTITLSPGTYNFYSLNLSGQSSLVVNPPGAVVINFPSTSANPISLTGQAIVGSVNANNMQINYGGTGTITLSGKGDSTMNVNAPNSQVTVSGNGDIYGRVIGQGLTWSGNGKFHFDKNSGMAPQSNATYRLISFRQISY